MSNQNFQKNFLFKVVTRTLTTFVFAVGINFTEFAMAESFKENSQLPSQHSQIIAQSNPGSHCLRLTHSLSGVVYQSDLRMNGTTGKMLTKYFDRSTKRTQSVEQTMRMVNTAQGIMILGFNPRYPGTNTKYPGYSADNFLFQVQPDGSSLFLTADDAGRWSLVEVSRCSIR